MGPLSPKIRRGARALLSLALAATPALGRAERPQVDSEAMHEAMGGGPDEHYVSSRAYFYYLRAMLEANASDHRAAIDDLRQAVVYDPDAPRVRVALAEQLERLGELAKAEEELKRAVQRNPTDEPTQYALGRVLAEQKRLSKAIGPLQRALQLKPTDPAPAIALAQVYLDQGQEEQAIKVIDALGKAAPGEASGYKSLGQVLAERGQPKKAERLLRAAKARNATDTETLQSLARLYEDQNRLPEAEAEYEQALAADPEEPNVLLAAGALALRRNDPATARAYFDQLLAVMPDDVDVKVKVAFAWFGARRLKEASVLLDEARRALPTDPRLAFYAGLIHEDQRAYDQAAEAFAAVDRAADLYPEASLHLGTCLSLAGKHAEAIASLKGALAEHPESRALTVALSDAYARAGQMPVAIDMLQQAADAQRADELYTALADLLARAGRPLDGVDVLRKALAGRPNDVKLLYAQALAYGKAGEVDKAVATMKQLLGIDPDNANALNFIAYTYADHGLNLEEADRLVKRALSLRPESGAFTDTLGWVAFKRGELRTAVEALQKAEELSPNEPVIIEHLGDVLVKTERHADGAAAYRRALQVLESDPNDPVRQEIEHKLRGLTSAQQAGK